MGGWAFRRDGGPHGATILRALREIGAIHERLKGVYIDNLDFRVCIRNWDGPETFFYCDPPYIGVTPYRLPFSDEDHEDLAGLLRAVRGKWLLTINDHPKACALYRGYRAARVEKPLSLMKVAGERRPKLRHLVVVNYDPPEDGKWRWRTL